MLPLAIGGRDVGVRALVGTPYILVTWVGESQELDNVHVVVPCTKTICLSQIISKFKQFSANDGLVYMVQRRINKYTPRNPLPLPLARREELQGGLEKTVTPLTAVLVGNLRDLRYCISSDNCILYCTFLRQYTFLLTDKRFFGYPIFFVFWPWPTAGVGYEEFYCKYKNIVVDIP